MSSPADAARDCELNQSVTSISQKNRHKINRAMTTFSLNDDTTPTIIQIHMKIKSIHQEFSKPLNSGVQYTVATKAEQQK